MTQGDLLPAGANHAWFRGISASVSTPPPLAILGTRDTAKTTDPIPTELTGQISKEMRQLKQ